MNLEEHAEGKAFKFSQQYKTILHQLTTQSEMSSSSGSRNKGLTGGRDLAFIRKAFASNLSVMEDGKRAEELSADAVMPSSVNTAESQVGGTIRNVWNFVFFVCC